MDRETNVADMQAATGRDKAGAAFFLLIPLMAYLRQTDWHCRTATRRWHCRSTPTKRIR